MRWRLHVNLWHAAAESLRRHPADAAAAFVPLLVAVAVCAAFNFVRDGMLADALLATGTLPDLTVQAMLGGRPDRLSAIRAEHIAHLDGVERTAARVWGYLPINTGGLALTYTLVGLDVDRMPRPDAIGLAMAGGRFLNKTDTDGAVIGTAVAAALNVKVGDELSLKDEMGNAARLKLVGVFTSDVQIYTTDLIITTLTRARQFFGYADGEASDLCVYLSNPESADLVASGIQSKARGTRVLSKGGMRDVVRQAYGSRSGVFQLLWMILLLTAMLAAWSQGNSVSRRMNREIGILKATGWSTTNIIEMKVFENAIVAGVATMGGLLLGLGYAMAGAPGIKSYFLGWAVIYPEMDLPVQVTAATVWMIAVIGIFPFLVATIIPAWAAGITDPDEAMRG